jgi:hypothetical protein
LQEIPTDIKKERSMEPTITTPPLSPSPSPASAKKSNAPIIIAVIAAVILSLCCCCPGILTLTGNSTFSTSGLLGDNSGTTEPLLGLICIGAAIIPLFIPVIVFLVQRSKK